MTKKEWLSEMVFRDTYGRLPNLSDVPMTMMTRKESFEKQGGTKKEIDELIYYLETGQTKSDGFADGGYLNGYAKGGWISGPQSGYPVSLGGSKPDFIGHGTEYVAQKEGSGDAFIVPFDTPATKVDKGLTERRMGEARSLGFFAEGGGYGGGNGKNGASG